MQVAVSAPVRLPHISWLTRAFLVGGILSSVLYVAMNILIPPLYPGYDSVSQTVSELSAVGAPTRMIWVIWGVVYTLLVALFGIGVLQSAGENRNIRIAGIFLLCYGIVSAFWPFAPMHQRADLAAAMGTISDTFHLILAGTTVVLMLLSMGFGAAALGMRFRIYTIVTMIVLLVFGLLTALDAPKVQANLPTPYAGVWERINVGVFLLWIIVLAGVRLQEKGVRR